MTPERKAELRARIASNPEVWMDEATELLDALDAAERERDAWRAKDWGDKPLPEDVPIDAAMPPATGRHDLYWDAMRLVGARRSKGSLVALVNWLLARVSNAERRAEEAEHAAHIAESIADSDGAHFKAMALLQRAEEAEKHAKALDGMVTNYAQLCGDVGRQHAAAEAALEIAREALQQVEDLADGATAEDFELTDIMCRARAALTKLPPRRTP